MKLLSQKTCFFTFSPNFNMSIFEFDLKARTEKIRKLKDLIFRGNSKFLCIIYLSIIRSGQASGWAPNTSETIVIVVNITVVI